MGANRHFFNKAESKLGSYPDYPYSSGPQLGTSRSVLLCQFQNCSVSRSQLQACFWEVCEAPISHLQNNNRPSGYKSIKGLANQLTTSSGITKMQNLQIQEEICLFPAFFLPAASLLNGSSPAAPEHLLTFIKYFFVGGGGEEEDRRWKKKSTSFRIPAIIFQYVFCIWSIPIKHNNNFAHSSNLLLFLIMLKADHLGLIF